MFSILVLAFAGLFLIFLEFFMPGAIMAIGGSLLLAGSLFLFHLDYPDLWALIVYLGSILAALLVVVRIAMWRIKATGHKGTIYLKDDQEGFQACLYPKELIGQVGFAATDLKPSGRIQINHQTFQALSQSEYIDRGTPIEVLGGHGSHLIVQSIGGKT